MLSIRMRASKEKRRRGNEHPHIGIHISGAEGLFREDEQMRIIREYIERALTHPRGEPDKIRITIERVKGRVKMVPSLAVTTLKCKSLSESEGHIRRLLMSAGVSGAAIKEAFKVIRQDEAMRGASIIRSVSGRRVEPDRTRGVRASRLGISISASKKLSRQLACEGIDTATVREAVVLASKVASCRQVIAELCVSDDPDYTTGYVASRKYGYLRIPAMKRRGSRKGGRVFFVEEAAEVTLVEEFIERKPVVVNSINECRGVRSIDEIFNNPYR